MKRWLTKKFTKLVFQFSCYVVNRVSADVFDEIVQEEIQKKGNIVCCESVNGIPYPVLKQIEDEWVDRGIIR